MEKNAKVYICKGCGIGDLVNIDDAIKEAAGTSKIPADNHAAVDVLCSLKRTHDGRGHTTVDGNLLPA